MSYSQPLILAIETSCDETAASVIMGGKILSNIVASQEEHEKHGGVVPELASRAHMQYILPVVQKALNQAKVHKNQLDAVACTAGPGLIGSLLVGTSFAKSLSMALQIPLIAVDHMQAHILAHFIDAPRPGFPFLCLTVSGGHTQIVKVDQSRQFTVLGRTQDDAVGEAFDKIAKLLGLPYPGGPHIDKLAKSGNALRFKFPIAQMPGLDFSFSGVKTAVRYFVAEQTKLDPDFLNHNLHDICASVQHTLVQTLMQKLKLAVKESGLTSIAIAGGVAANSGLRIALESMKENEGWDVFIPDFQYCTDNAAMIAMAAHFQYLAGEFVEIDFQPYARQTL